MIEQKEATSEKTVLIGVITQKQDETKSTEYLDELEFLTATAGGVVVERFVQKMDKILSIFVIAQNGCNSKSSIMSGVNNLNQIYK